MKYQADVFLTWVKQHAHTLNSLEPGSGFDDLQVLKEIIGAARVVGIAESMHATHEFTTLQHRIVEFLVEEMDFTAVAVESGLAESKIIHDFVSGGDAPSDFWESGLVSYYSKWQEMRRLVKWIRAYNSDPTHKRKINFYGIDIPGYYKSWMPALEVIVTYLDNVDPEYAKQTREKTAPLVQAVTSRENVPSYEVYGRLASEQRNELAVAINALVDHLELYRIDYLCRSSKNDYDWAFRAAKNLRQVDVYYRTLVEQYLNPVQPPPPVDARDLAMADNMRWIIEREGTHGRIALLNFNTHIQTMPTKTVSGKSATAAMYLQSLMDIDYVAIGTAYNKGTRWDRYEGPQVNEIQPSKTDSVDGILARVGLPAFILNLGSASKHGPISRFLEQDIETRVDVSYGVTKLRSWDALIYIDEISPARPVLGD